MKLGIIGCGNMAGSMLTQMLVNGFVQKEDVMASAYHEKRRKQLRERYGIAVTDDNVEVAQDADILLIGVKPQEYRNIIMEIRSVVKPETLVIAIAVGVTMDGIKDLFGKPVKLTRAMPNIAAQVGEGVTGFCTNFYVQDEDKEIIVHALESFGKAIEVAEKDLEVVSSIGSAAPAFVYIMIEALADGAVAEGLKRDLAYQFASQMVLGSGLLVRDGGIHPGTWKDMVCSPGGTTIEGVSVLEEKGFRSALIQAIRACVKKSHTVADQ